MFVRDKHHRDGFSLFHYYCPPQFQDQKITDLPSSLVLGNLSEIEPQRPAGKRCPRSRLPRTKAQSPYPAPRRGIITPGCEGGGRAGPHRATRHTCTLNGCVQFCSQAALCVVHTNKPCAQICTQCVQIFAHLRPNLCAVSCPMCPLYESQRSCAQNCTQTFSALLKPYKGF